MLEIAPRSDNEWISKNPCPARKHAPIFASTGGHVGCGFTIIAADTRPPTLAESALGLLR
jgi:hypothetical protein